MSTYHLPDCPKSPCACGAPSEKPEAIVVGQDGNAYSVMGIVSRSLKRAGASKSYIDQYYEDATSGDYDNLLVVSWKYANLG